MQLFPDQTKMKSLFGEAGVIYGSLGNAIAPYLLRDQYSFMDNHQYEQMMLTEDDGLEKGARIYWEEMLDRAHMASVSSIIRASRWVDSSMREYEAGNLFGWAAATRSLVEAAADSGHSLGVVPITLAEIHKPVIAALKGKAGSFLTSSDIEDALIHYSHARKVSKAEEVPISHKARQSAEYLRFLEEMKIDGARELYSKLCEIVHPAAMSVSTTFTFSKGGWTVDLAMERTYLNAFVESNRGVISGVLMAAFNPAILILRVLHRFDRHVKIPPLKNYRLDRIPAWTRIQKALK